MNITIEIECENTGEAIAHLEVIKAKFMAHAKKVQANIYYDRVMDGKFCESKEVYGNHYVYIGEKIEKAEEEEDLQAEIPFTENK